MQQALADPGAASQLQTASSTNSSQGPCFGYNHVDDSAIPRIVSSLRVALVQPILTSTPYSQYESGSFYAFYAKESGVTTNVTANLDLLSTDLSSGYGYNKGWGLSYGMDQFFTSQTAANCGLVVGKNVQVLTDLNVSQGALFYPQNQSARFDVVVLPFSEYVTDQEYLAYEEFVAGGGTLEMMAHSLEYPVTYNATTNMETLVYGHGWAFTGTYAYPVACSSNTYVASCPWAKNNTDWTGSNTCEASCFHTYKYNGSLVNTGSSIGKALYDEFGGTVFASYVSHEENSVTNMTGTSIVSVFVNDSTNLIASYTHQFRRGTVVCFGFFGDDIIATDQSAQYLLLSGMVSGRLGSAQAVSSSTITTATSSTVARSLTGSSTSEQTPESGTSAPQGGGAVPGVLAVLGGLALVAIAASVVVIGQRRRRTRA